MISVTPNYLTTATYAGIVQYRGRAVHNYTSSTCTFSTTYIGLDSTWVAVMPGDHVGLEFASQPMPLMAPDNEIFVPYQMDCIDPVPPS